MDGIFAKFLKKLRMENELSQAEAMRKLTIANNQFLGVDSVTFSRWERGVTLPHKARQVSIIRVFTNDLYDYLSQLYKTSYCDGNSKFNYVESLIRNRYSHPSIIISNASYYSSITNYEKEICIEPLNDSNCDTFNMNLKSFLESVDAMRIVSGLVHIDIMDFHQQNRISVQRYVVDGVTHGHTIKAFFNNENIDEEIISLNSDMSRYDQDINLELSVPYDSSQPLSCYMVSRYAVSEDVFRRQLSEECRFLAQHANIHYFYMKITLKATLEVMLKLGFEVATHGPENSSGGIKIGNKRYSWAILVIPTNFLLSRPEFMHFMVR